MYQIEVSLPKATSKDALNLLGDLLENVSVFEDPATLGWLVRIIYETHPPEGIEDDVRMLMVDLGLEPSGLTYTELPKTDWLAENRKSFPAMTIGNFYIYGSHLKPSDKPGWINLQLDASLAFGTGKHATTRGCLEFIQELEKPLSQAHLLDLGCGTAILAMAMAKLWQLPVIASDIDHDSVILAEKNVHLNHVQALVKVIEADGFTHPDIQAAAPFDVIVANILAAPLIHMAPAMQDVTKSEGRLILSGLLQTQVSDVVQAYVSHGFELLETKEIEEWAALLLKKLNN